MKKIGFIFSILFLAIMIPVAAQAQSAGKVKISVPFDFGFAGKAYAAGSYRFQISNNTTGTAVVALEDEQGKVLDTVFSIPAVGVFSGEPDLKFDDSTGVKSIKSVVLHYVNYSLPAVHPLNASTTRIQPKAKTPKDS
ncbi:MAG: hypothetical protein ABI878_00380 [Acidobacteriota bacterium]